MERSILVSVSYTESKRAWADSSIKNLVVTFTSDIHGTIASLLEKHDGMEISYNGKPTGNVYVDDKDGKPVTIGYTYRTKAAIQCEDGSWMNARFTAWVTIREVIPFDGVKDIDE